MRLRLFILALATVAVACAGTEATAPMAAPPAGPAKSPPRSTPACKDHVSLDGPAVLDEHRLAVLTMKNAGDSSAVAWMVTPEDGADFQIEGGKLFLTGRPGVYSILGVVVTVTDGKPAIAQIRHRLEIRRTTPPAPPAPPAPKPPSPPPAPGPEEKPKGNPAKALGKINFAGSGCTATPIWPRRPDGRWEILTAAHCVRSVGQRGTFETQDGRRIAVRVTVREARSDLAWLVTDEPVDSLHFAVLADTMPARGTRVWHAGYGWDRPGNREEGTLNNADNGSGMASYTLNVSNGDSGGGIFDAETGRWLGAVCCTSGIARIASVSAGNAVRAAQIRPRSGSAEASEDAFAMPEGMTHPISKGDAQADATDKAGK